MSKATCSEAECDSRHYALGLCRNHYNREKRAEQRVNPTRLCNVGGCTQPHNARGMCSTHYKKWQASLRSCAVGDCEKPYARSGYCRGHWDRLQRHGDPLAGPPIRDRAPNGSPRPVVTSGGYVLVWAPEHPNAQANGYILEHVQVMAQSLGRALFKGENVHHINGNRADNRPENLELWVTMQPSGQRPADLVRYAQEILDRYGDAPPNRS